MNDASLNPYQSPTVAEAIAPGEQSEIDRGQPLETYGLVGTASIYRLAAAIFDEAAAVLLFFVAAMPLATAADLQPLALFVGVVLWLAYFFLTEWTMSATPGKLLTGLRVRQVTGKRCTVRQIVVRTIWRIVEVNPLICGLFPAGIAVNCTVRHQRIGDLMAGTLVVRKSQLRNYEGTS
jgi:uncharacterized RDD family membrane protein YckC